MGTEQLEDLDVLGQLIVVERNGEAGHDVDVLEVGEFQRLDVTDRGGFYTLRQLMFLWGLCSLLYFLL